MKICSQCNELVAETSLVCKHCHSIMSMAASSDSEQSTVQPPPKNAKPKESAETFLARAKGELKKGELNKASCFHQRAIELSCSAEERRSTVRLIEKDSRSLIENAEQADEYLASIKHSKPVDSYRLLIARTDSIVCILSAVFGLSSAILLAAGGFISFSWMPIALSVLAMAYVLAHEN